MTDASLRRRHRADVARRLVGRRDADARWDALPWQTLGELPHWCALDEPHRRELRDLAGIVSLLPAVRRCVRGEILLALRARIGEERLSALRARPYGVDDDGAELVSAERLDAQLAERGAHALAATVGEPLARELLLGTLRPDGASGTDDGRGDGVPEGSFAAPPEALGRRAVRVAEELLATAHAATTVRTDA